jgi:tmRNA-binding protein
MKTVATNKPAYFNYELVDTFEAGIALRGRASQSRSASMASRICP